MDSGAEAKRKIPGLIDHKAENYREGYGSLIHTGCLVAGAQGGIVLIPGIRLVLNLAAACWLGLRALSAAGALIFRFRVLGVSGMCVLWRRGLDGELTQEILRRAPASRAGVLRPGMKQASL